VLLQAGLIIAGWDAHDGAAVWALPLGGTLLKVPYAIGGSGSAYIYGFCDKHFRCVVRERPWSALAPLLMLQQHARPGAQTSSGDTPTNLVMLCRPGMSEQEAKDFVVRALSHAMARDASSGGCIRTVIIDKDSVRRDFCPGNLVPLTYGDLPTPGAVAAARSVASAQAAA
jgi:20S proteasome subunit beta 1